MRDLNYPGVFKRVKAVITDSVVLIAFMILITDIFSSFNNVPNVARIIAFVFIFVLYDPLFTSISGGTIGHKLNGIRVRQETKDEKVTFPLAIIRFLAKTLLGWISFLTVSSSEKGKAIHDVLVGSIVVFDKKKSTSN